VAFRIPVWSGSSRATLVAHPRIYLFDLGVRNALLRRPLDRPFDDERGLLLEHLIAYELHRRSGDLWPELELFYFRTKHDLEVDFLARVGREIWAIEVKSTRNVSPPMLTGLKRIGEQVPGVTRRILLFLGARPQAVDGVEVLPVEDFLATLPT